MATPALSSFPNLHKPFFASQPHHHHLHLRLLPQPPRRSLPTAICASSLNKTRGTRTRKKARSDADVCKDLQEFVSEAGFPEGHVPSLQELSQHGRQDLANIVRRRGYKLIRELLAASTQTNDFAPDVEGFLTEEQGKASAEEDESTGHDENAKKSAEDVSSLSGEAQVVEENFNVKGFNNDATSSLRSCLSVAGSTKSSLQGKVAKFIQSGELETVEDNGHHFVNESTTDNEKGISESLNLTESELSSVSEEQSDKVLCTETPDMVNGSIPTSQLVHSTFEIDNLRTSSNDHLASADSDKDLDIETKTNEDKTEVDRIRFLLHQKELELSHLKEQIEKEKLALSQLQTKAETEISKAHKLLLDKDAELHAAEESLSGLKQVEIDYWGEGETVEVAGSFNGWHHGVKMDPLPSSNITDPVKSRKSRLWRATLWLYPGIYEIKFIIDGKWMIDPMKEVVTRGSIQNNVLRVNR